MDATSEQALLAKAIDLFADARQSEPHRTGNAILRLAHSLTTRLQAEANELKHAVSLREEYLTHLAQWRHNTDRLDRLNEDRIMKLAMRDQIMYSAGREQTPLGYEYSTNIDGPFEPNHAPSHPLKKDLTNPEIQARLNAATIPDMVPLRAPCRLERHSDDRGGLIEDPEAFMKGQEDPGEWSETEAVAFNEAYLAAPNDFDKIASKIPGKTRQQCVLYFYLHKMGPKLKELSAERTNNIHALAEHPSFELEDQAASGVLQDLGTGTAIPSERRAGAPRIPWTEEENAALIRLHTKHRTEWDYIAGHFSGQTAEGVRSQYIAIQLGKHVVTDRVGIALHGTQAPASQSDGQTSSGPSLGFKPSMGASERSVE